MANETIFQPNIVRATRYLRRPCHAGSEHGSAILETALSMVILLTFLFGIIETALALYTYHFISEASREAVRYAIVRGSSSGGTCASYDSAYCAATKAQVTSFVQNLGFPGINPAKMTVTTAYAAYPAGVTCTPLSNCTNPGNLVTVTVQYNFPLVVPFVPTHTYAMTSTAAMVISQ
jgi:Flp pilus assembly protein TadG